MANETALTNGNLALLRSDVEFVPPIRSVEADKDYNFFGSYTKLISHDLDLAANFITSNSKDDDKSETVVKQHLSNCLTQAYEDYQLQKDACWFTIRMTTGDPDTTVPRWHRDGRYFDLDSYSDTVATTTNGGEGSTNSGTTLPLQLQQQPSKYATTLLGPGTLFLNLPLDSADLSSKPIPNTSGPYTDYLTGGENLDTRRRVADFFNAHDVPVVRAELGQVARFAYGKQYGVVHSEPDMSACDRVFVSVLFGSIEQLRGLCERWGREWVG